NSQTVFFFSSRRRHTRLQGDWSSDVCSSDLRVGGAVIRQQFPDCRARLLPTGRLVEGERGAVGGDDGREALARHAERVRQFVLKIGRASCRERGRTAEGGVSVITKTSTQYSA